MVKLHQPETYQLKSADEITVGMTMCYTGNPAGKGVLPTKGSMWEIRSREDIQAMQIEINDLKRGWEPLKQ